MKAKISSLIAFVLLSAAALTMLVGSPNTQPSGNSQTEPEVSVPGMVSTSSDNEGMPTVADTVLPSTRYGLHIDLNQPSVTLDPLDIHSFALDANQIGVNRSVAVSPETRPQKFVNPDGSQIIVLIIRSSGASGIGVHFRNLELARGEEVYVYGPAADSIVSGPYTNKGPWDSGEFWSATIAGETAIIEFYSRTGENVKAFEIFEISHIFAKQAPRWLTNGADVLTCEADASCYSDVEKNAVGRILYNNNGAHVCTGTLLNDRAQDHIPYFLTANHCVSTQAIAQTVEVYWFYQTTSCNSGVLRSWVHSPPGANLLAAQSSNDFSLLRLMNNAPGGTLFSGWTSGTQSTGTAVFGLHHPGGCDPGLCIDSYLRRDTGSITSTNVTCSSTGLVNGYLASWTNGTTEPGSSGSGLWNSSHYLVGVLSCGDDPATCDNPSSWYSEFANFYSQIRPYIDPVGTPTPTPTPVSGCVAPAVATSAASNIASNSATLNGTVNPNGCSTTVRFQYGTTTSYGSTTANQTFTGMTTRSVSANISGLSPSTTYHFRIVATNMAGTTYGSDRTFTTLSTTGPPVVSTSPATLIASFSATLNGSVDPHGLTTTVNFQYGTTTSYGSTTASQTMTGNTYLNISANISGLMASTVYHFRIAATNSAGTRYGSDMTFTTLSSMGPPIVTTNPATLIASFSATINGSVDPHGLSTTVYFQYGTTTSYGSTTASQTKTGNTYQNVSANISGLTASTTYHFRIVATNSSGTTHGSDMTLTTLTATGPPVVTTNPASNVLNSSATLNGTVDPHGLSTSVQFQYGTTTSYGSTTASQTKTGNTYQSVSANISGLNASTTYHFRILATNSAGTTHGGDRTFTTAAACSWVIRAPVPYNARGIFAASDGTYVYAGGGHDGSTAHADLLRYNPATNTWASLAPSADQHYLSQAVYNSGKIYNMGGFNTAGFVTSVTRIYNIATNTWTTGAPMPAFLADQATVLWNGKIYVAGGYNGSVIVNTLYVYNIATNTWSTLAPMPQALALPGFGAINGKLYIASGSNGTSELNTLYIYDIASNTWTTGANVPTGVNGPGSTVFCGKLYLYGGGYPTPRNITQIYDPVTNTWSSGANLNVARRWFYGSAVGSAIVAPGGNTTTSIINANEQLAGCQCP